MDISCPPSLSTADSALNLAEALAKLLDPKEREKIANDIKSHHALNEVEAKKTSDARALIKQHTDILSQNQKISEQNKKDSESLSQEKISFKQECESERLKIADEWSKVNKASEEAKNLYKKAEGMINDISIRDNNLQKEKSEHEENVLKLAEKSKDIDKQKSEIDEYKRQVIALDNETKNKVEKLKQFNF